MKQLFKKPSYYLISSAMDGNEKAIEKLLAFYDPYISKCCLRSLYDEYGAYSARTAHPFQRNGAPFRFKLSKAQQVD